MSASTDGIAEGYLSECETQVRTLEWQLSEATKEIERLRAELVVTRACANGMALDALKALRDLTGSQNDENPWLGITAAVALLHDRSLGIPDAQPIRVTR